MRISLSAAVVAAGLCLLVAAVAIAETTVGELEPSLGTWRVYDGSRRVCVADSEQAMLACAAEDAERRGESTRYQLRYPNRYVTVEYSAPTCGDRPGPDEQEPRDCPSGTVGAWLQDRVWTLLDYPTCWTQGDWTPSSPPEGMCVPADSDGDGVPDSTDECPTVYAAGEPNGCPATPPELLPAPTNVRAEGVSTTSIVVTWDAVAGAASYSVRRCIGSSCEPMDRPPLVCTRALEQLHGPFQSAGLTVSYRVQAAATADCSGELSAPSDPIVRGTALTETTPEPPEPEPEPEPVGTGTLPWEAPTHNTDGSILSDLAGYRVVWGQDPNALTNVQQVGAGTLSFTVTGLAPGTWYFAVKAFNASGRESDLSAVRSKVVQ